MQYQTRWDTAQKYWGKYLSVTNIQAAPVYPHPTDCYIFPSSSKSTNLQRQLRRKKDDNTVMNETRKELRELIVRNSLYKLNEIAESKLFKDFPDTTRNYQDLQIDIFKQPLKDELKWFVHVRTFKTKSIAKDDATKIPTKKSKLDGAKNGEENNLIRTAYVIRCTLPIMSRPNTDEDGNILMKTDNDDDYDVEMVGGNVIDDWEEGL